MIQCTIYEHPKRIIDTEYGKITFKDWLEFERERIEEGAQVRHRIGQIALWVSEEGLNLLTTDNKYDYNYGHKVKDMRFA